MGKRECTLPPATGLYTCPEHVYFHSPVTNGTVHLYFAFKASPCVSAGQTIQHQIIGILINNELKKNMEAAVMA
jgi:hypothetical protein